MTIILLVEDNAFTRDGMSRYLRQHGFAVLEAGDAETGWQVAAAERPAAAVLDVVIPARPGEGRVLHRSAGIELMTRLKHAYPQLGIVIFSAYEDRGAGLFDLLHEGARGLAYLLKGAQPATLLQAIATVCSGQVLIEAEVTQKQSIAGHILDRLQPEERPWVTQAVAAIPRLSLRETAVAQRLAAAHTARGIAEALTITPKSVANYTRRIYRKLGLDGMDEQTLHLRKSAILAKAILIDELQREG